MVSKAWKLPSYSWYTPIVYIGMLDRQELMSVAFPPDDNVSHFQVASLLLALSDTLQRILVVKIRIAIFFISLTMVCIFCVNW